MLKVCSKTIHNMCRSGTLEPVYKEGHREKYFRLHDVAAVAEAIHQKMDLPKAASIALQALATARANERRLDELFKLLGLQRKVLSSEASEVLTTYESAREMLGLARQPTLEEVEDWSATFFAIDETYLALVKAHTASEEPWRVFMDLATKWSVDRENVFLDLPDAKMAYGHFESSRRHLRIVSYMFCRNANGVQTANRLFGTENFSDRIIDVIFSTDSLARYTS